MTQHDGSTTRGGVFVRTVDLTWLVSGLGSLGLLAADVFDDRTVGPLGLLGAVLTVVAGVAFLHSRMVRQHQQAPDDEVASDAMAELERLVQRRRDDS